MLSYYLRKILIHVVGFSAYWAFGYLSFYIGSISINLFHIFLDILVTPPIIVFINFIQDKKANNKIFILSFILSFASVYFGQELSYQYINEHLYHNDLSDPEESYWNALLLSITVFSLIISSVVAQIVLMLKKRKI